MNIISGLFKTIHWPMCRTYTRHIGNKPVNPSYAILFSCYFRRVYGFWPNLEKPQRFTEKLWYRMLYDRDPILTLVCDKLLVRDYVTRKIGRDFLVPLLWYGNDPEKIPFENLPDKFVIKTNNSCGENIIVHNKLKLDVKTTKQKIKKWFNRNPCSDTYLGIGWGYKNIKPMILIETFIGEKDKPPIDYKFYCFSGHVEIITLHFDRFEEQKVLAYDNTFQPLKYKSKFKQFNGAFQLPPNCDKMLALAEKLSEDFEFIRVDLYNLAGEIFFGELTPYPGGVSTLNGFDVTRYDFALGEKWKTNK